MTWLDRNHDERSDSRNFAADWDDGADRYDEPRASVGCRCGDMPGRCPGPDNCPLCEPLDDEGDDE